MRNEKGDKRVRRLRTDGGGEYDSKAFARFREEKGIIREPIIPGNPQMNGAAGRLGQTLHCMANALRKDSGFAIQYWPELILTANYLRNREPVVGRDITPIEVDTQRPPFLGHLRRIGQRGVAQLRKPATGWLHFQDHGRISRLIGYEGNHIYRMVEASGKIMRYSNVGWIDNEVEAKKEHPPEPLASASKRQRPNSTQEEPLKTPETSNITNEIPVFADYQPFEPAQDFSHPSRNSLPSRSVSILSSAPSFSDSSAPPPTTSIHPAPVHRPVTRSQGKVSAQPQALVASDQPLPISTPQLFGLLSAATNPESIEPKTYKQAIGNQNPKQHDWKRAMQEEIDYVLENDTWILTSLPPGRKALDGKWVYKIKRGLDGKIQRYKARWVVRDFQQREGIDYAETFASVVKPMSYKAIFALSCANNWEIHQMDVRTWWGENDRLLASEVLTLWCTAREIVMCTARKMCTAREMCSAREMWKVYAPHPFLCTPHPLRTHVRYSVYRVVGPPLSPPVLESG